MCYTYLFVSLRSKMHKFQIECQTEYSEHANSVRRFKWIRLQFVMKHNLTLDLDIINQ